MSWSQTVLICEGKNYQKIFKAFDPICVNTLKKYIEIITKDGQKKISEKLPEKFCIIFDGWTKSLEFFLEFLHLSRLKTRKVMKLSCWHFRLQVVRSVLLQETSSGFCPFTTKKNQQRSFMSCR